MPQVTNSIEVPIRGMTCGNCALGVEKRLHSLGLSDARVSIATESAFVTPTSDVPLSQITSAITELGFHVPASANVLDTPIPNNSLTAAVSRFLESGTAAFIAALFTVPFLVHMVANVPLLHDPLIQALFAAVPCTIGLARFIPSAIGSLRARTPNMEVLISIGILASLGYSFYGWIIGEAAAFSFFESAATIATLVLVGSYLENRAGHRARSAIAELAKLQPSNAVRVRGELRETIPASALEIDDVVAVNTGDGFPCDGVVISGQAAVDESIATGESGLQNRRTDDVVISGTVVMQGSVLVRITKQQSESFVQTMVSLVKRAQTEKPPIGRTADRIAAIFVPLILVLSVLTCLGCLIAGLPTAEAITRAVAVLVISCPCALGIATPAAVMVGISRAAKRNILFRSGASVEALAGINAIAFDKTGTITGNGLGIQIASVDRRYSTGEIEAFAKALEMHSSHPIGKQILEKCAGAAAATVHSVREQIGSGVHGVAADGAALFIGRDVRSPDNTVLVRNDAIIGTFTVTETLRDGVSETLKYFKDIKIPLWLVSGDSQRRCEALGLNSEVQIFGAQSPQQKQATIQGLNKRVAFVGDGVNDAPVLATAAVGISLSHASSVAVNSADVVLVSASMATLTTAHKMAKATLKTIRENLFWAFSYNIIAVPIAMAGLLSPSWAALAMGFSDVILILNSLRLQVKRFD